MKKRLFLGFACLGLLSACGNNPQVSTPEITSTLEETTVEEQVVNKSGRTITIRSIGDILIHDALYYNAATGNGYNFDHMFAPVKPYIENADITTANLEVIAAGDVYEPSTYPFFNSPSEIIDALQKVGVDIVNNATNHTVDLGAEGALASIDALQARNMPYVGSYQSWEDYKQDRILEVNGVKVGFLAYSYGSNGNYIPEDQAYVLTLIDHETMAKEVELLKDKVDISVVMVHQGEEYDSLPSAYQAQTNNVLRDAGASFILGGHPHVLQPFIVYNKHQAGLFSHGNFLSGQIETDTKIGGIAEYTFTEIDGRFEVTSLRFMPTFTIGSGYGDYYVVPLAEWAEYGISGGQELFDGVVKHMRYYSNLVEVVEYLE